MPGSQDNQSRKENRRKYSTVWTCSDGDRAWNWGCERCQTLGSVACRANPPLWHLVNHEMSGYQVSPLALTMPSAAPSSSPHLEGCCTNENRESVSSAQHSRQNKCSRIMSSFCCHHRTVLELESSTDSKGNWPLTGAGLGEGSGSVSQRGET